MTTARKRIALLALPLLLILLGEAVCRVLFPIPPVADALHAKPAGTFRVIAIGGSTARGLHVPEMGFVDQLEAILREERPDLALEVHNFGKGARASKTVRVVVEETLDDDPDLYIVLTGHNEFLFRTGTGGASEAIQSALRGSALFRNGQKAVDRLRGPRVKRDSDYVLPKKLVPYDRESEWFGEKQQAYGENLAAIADATREAGVPLVLCTPPANLFDWPPVHEAVAWAKNDADYDATVQGIEARLAQDDAEAALEMALRSTETHGPDAMIAYLTGQALARLGRTDEARDALWGAVDLDPYPWRVLPGFNEVIRELGKRADVHLADVERAFETGSSNGLVGFDLVSDNCHPTPLGNAVAALCIARVMAENGLFLESSADLPAHEAWLEGFLGELEAEGQLGALRLKYLLDNAVYSMKTPFRNYETATTYFEAGLGLAPDDWRFWANHGTLALLEGDREAGVERLRRAVELRGRVLDANDEEDTRAVPYLKEATIRAGVDLADLDTASG